MQNVFLGGSREKSQRSYHPNAMQLQLHSVRAVTPIESASFTEIGPTCVPEVGHFFEYRTSNTSSDHRGRRIPLMKVRLLERYDFGSSNELFV